MAYEVVLTDLAADELRALRRFEYRRLTEEIAKQLTHQPTVATRNRKCLGTVPAGFEHIPPLWELRVGHYRVFYDVEEATQTVQVRAVRRKDQEQTTEDILT
jgi:mRNA-degrading endonuclease RelE of RelBE toxin-antitoxin system